MLSKSFMLFFISPIISLWHLWKKTNSFLRSLFTQILFKKTFDLSDKSVLDDAHKVFRIILLVVMTRIAINEAFLDKDTDFVKDGFSELLILVTYFCLFQINYYYGKLLALIKKNELYKALYIKLWQAYTLAFLIMLFINSFVISNDAMNDFGIFDKTLKVLMFLYLIHTVYMFIKIKVVHKLFLLFLMIIPIVISVVFFNFFIHLLIK